jgi:hypothetical protein
MRILGRFPTSRVNVSFAEILDRKLFFKPQIDFMAEKRFIN